MKEELVKEKTLLDFYKKMVALIQVDTSITEDFFNQAFTCMMIGHEFGYDRICSRKVYDMLLLTSLSYNMFRQNENKDFFDNIENLVYPFSVVDKDGYYKGLLEDNFLLQREIMFLSRLTSELERGNCDDIALSLLNQANSDCISTFKTFSHLNRILREGWKRRNVEHDFLESDAAHTMQMMAFASAYITLFKPQDLDYKKVMEMILIHETGEILAGDITELDPNHNSKHDVELVSVKATFGKLKCGQYFIRLWEEFEDRESNEAKFVYALDKFDPIVKADYLDETLGRNDLFKDFFDYEKNRGTFKEGKLKKVFICLENSKK